jgi:hypothetical protein
VQLDTRYAIYYDALARLSFDVKLNEDEDAHRDDPMPIVIQVVHTGHIES